MNTNYEIKILRKNWLLLNDEEKELLEQRKIRENEFFDSRDVIYSKRIEEIEKKFLNAILRTQKTYAKYFEEHSILEIQRFSLPTEDLKFIGLFTSLHENYEDNYQPIVFEQEITNGNFKKFLAVKNIEHKKIFDHILKPCFFSNLDLLSITDINVEINIKLEIDDINKMAAL